MDDKLYLRRGTSPDGPFSLAVTPEQAGWAYSGLKVLTLAARRHAHAGTPARTRSSSCRCPASATVTCDGTTFDLHGRRSVFSRVTDFSYAPRDASVTVTSRDGGSVRHPLAPAARAGWSPATARPRTCRSNCAAPARPAARSTTSARRRRSSADKLIAVEVLTPGGNWSSYPPHKHDETRPGDEAELEEIYYFEIANRPGATSASTAPPSRPDRRAGRGRAPATWCWSRTAGTGPRSPRPATTCTTSTSWRARGRTGLAFLRRPRARLDPRHLGGPGHRPPPAADLGDREGG